MATYFIDFQGEDSLRVIRVDEKPEEWVFPEGPRDWLDLPEEQQPWEAHLQHESPEWYPATVLGSVSPNQYNSPELAPEEIDWIRNQIEFQPDLKELKAACEARDAAHAEWLEAQMKLEEAQRRFKELQSVAMQKPRMRNR